MATDIIDQEGEPVHAPALEVLSGGAVAELSKAEIAQQVATARQYPRSVKRASSAIQSLVTLDAEAAEDCIYALPRGGKPIRGPSVRLAEVVAQSWGNNRVAARVVEIDRQEKVIVAEAVFHDLETNAAVKTSVRRRISDRQGRLLNDDMIVVTGNAACSIAKRNAILGGVPKAVWNRAYNAAEGVIKGDVKTLAERRERAIKSFGTWGVKPEQIFAALGVAGEEEVTLEHLPSLIGMYNAIKNGEETVETLFSGRDAASNKQFTRIANPLKDEEGGKPGQGGAAPKPQEGDAQAEKPKAAETGGKPQGASASASAGGQAEEGKPEGQGGNTAEAVDAAFATIREHGEAAARRNAARKPPAKLTSEEAKGVWLEAYDKAAGELQAADADGEEG